MKRIRRGSVAALAAEVDQWKRNAAHFELLGSANEKRVNLLESQQRSTNAVLEAERAELLARVSKIDALLVVLGRTRSHGCSPEY